MAKSNNILDLGRILFFLLLFSMMVFLIFHAWKYQEITGGELTGFLGLAAFVFLVLYPERRFNFQGMSVENEKSKPIPPSSAQSDASPNKKVNTEKDTMIVEPSPEIPAPISE
jgi:hypothetical protein